MIIISSTRNRLVDRSSFARWGRGQGLRSPTQKQMMPRGQGRSEAGKAASNSNSNSRSRAHLWIPRIRNDAAGGEWPELTSKGEIGRSRLFFFLGLRVLVVLCHDFPKSHG